MVSKFVCLHRQRNHQKDILNSTFKGTTLLWYLLCTAIASFWRVKVEVAHVKMQARDDLSDRAVLVMVVTRVDLHARPDLPDRAELVEVVARVDLHARPDLPDRAEHVEVVANARPDLPDRAELVEVVAPDDLHWWRLTICPTAPSLSRW